MHSIKRVCPRCHGLFLLDAGTARCPHCGQVVAADGSPPSASSMRAASRSGFTFIGSQAQRNARGRSGFKPVFSKPDLRERKALANALTEKADYWKQEIEDIVAEFGWEGVGAPILDMAKRLGVEPNE